MFVVLCSLALWMAHAIHGGLERQSPQFGDFAGFPRLRKSFRTNNTPRHPQLWRYSTTSKALLLLLLRSLLLLLLLPLRRLILILWPLLPFRSGAALRSLARSSLSNPSPRTPPDARLGHKMVWIGYGARATILY